VLEKIVPVSRVEVFIDKQEAIVELKTPAVCPATLLLWYDVEIFLTGRRTVAVEDRTNNLRRQCAEAGRGGYTLLSLLSSSKSD
jgi:hypothetical protein